MFDVIFLTLFFLTWALLGGLVWLGGAVRRGAHGALWALPFGPLGGAAGGVLVPVLGLDNGVGVGVSMLGALAGAAVLTALAYRVWDDYDLAARFRRLAARDPFRVPPALTGDGDTASIQSPQPDPDSAPDPTPASAEDAAD